MPTQARHKKKTAKKQPQIVSDEGEIIDTHISSDESLSTDNEAGAPVVIVQTQVTPIIPSAQTSRSVCAHDVNYFFMHGDKKTNVQAVCKVCR